MIMKKIFLAIVLLGCIFIASCREVHSDGDTSIKNTVGKTEYVIIYRECAEENIKKVRKDVVYENEAPIVLESTQKEPLNTDPSPIIKAFRKKLAEASSASKRFGRATYNDNIDRDRTETATYVEGASNMDYRDGEYINDLDMNQLRANRRSLIDY
jgi:hypothetical protein